MGMEQGKRYFVIAKLGPVKIAWIIREKEKGKLTNRIIADRMNVSERWVQKFLSNDSLFQLLFHPLVKRALSTHAFYQKFYSFFG